MQAVPPAPLGTSTALNKPRAAALFSVSCSESMCRDGGLVKHTHTGVEPAAKWESRSCFKTGFQH